MHQKEYKDDEEDGLFREKIPEILKSMANDVKARHFAAGLPIVYAKDGWIVEEYSDGKIVKVKELSIS